MELFAYPDRLSNLAAESLGKYVSDLVQRVKFPQCTETEAFRLRYVQQTCLNLGEMIHLTLPPSFANEVTIRILRRVLLSYRDLVEYPCFRNYCAEIAPVIVSAVLHPLVMKLECFETNPHPSLIDRYKVWYSDLIFDSLSKLKNLKVLRLGSSNNFTERRLNDGDFSEELEEFSYRFCEDDELEALSRKATRLRRLDVSDSYLTDVSVEYIICFRNLEELVVNCVLLTEDGLTRLLNGLAEPKEDASSSLSKQLKSFGCNNPTSYHLDLLSDKFSNLRSLSLRNVHCSLVPLNKLKYLYKLSLRTVVFSFIDELLRVIGRQIVCLNLRDIHDTDLQVISENCSSLRCLHLSFIKFVGLEDCKMVADFPKSFPLPEFRTLTCLELKLFDDNFSQYIMSKCGNVKKLFLSDGASQTLINVLLQRKQLMCLEQLFFTESQNVDIVVQFTDHLAVITEVDYYSDKVTLHSTPIK